MEILSNFRRNFLPFFGKISFRNFLESISPDEFRPEGRNSSENLEIFPPIFEEIRDKFSSFFDKIGNFSSIFGEIGNLFADFLAKFTPGIVPDRRPSLKFTQKGEFQTKSMKFFMKFQEISFLELPMKGISWKFHEIHGNSLWA